MPFRVSRFDWLPDLPDHRDRLYTAPVAVVGVLPAEVDLLPHCPPVYDQGQPGSCTAYAIAGATESGRVKQELASYTVTIVPLQQRTGYRTFGGCGQRCASPRWHQERRPSGRLPGNGMAVCRRPIQSRAAEQVLRGRLPTRGGAASRVTQTLNQLKGCLASGYHLVFGFNVMKVLKAHRWERKGVQVCRPLAKRPLAATRWPARAKTSSNNGSSSAIHGGLVEV